jgi:hypothetical protein
VKSARQGFQAELKGKKIPKRVREKIWEEEALPYLKERVALFLRQRTAPGSDEYEAVWDSLVQTISEKK